MNKNPFKVNVVKIIFTIFSFFTFLSFAPSSPPPSSLFDDSGYLPPEWYELPEYKSQLPKSSLENQINTRSIEENNKYLDESIDNIMSSQVKVLNQIGPTTKNRWQLTTITTGLSVGVNGIVGMNILSGLKAMEIYWRKAQNDSENPSHATDPVGPGILSQKNTSSKDEEKDQLKENSPEIFISSAMNDEQLKYQLEPSIKAVLSVRKIKNEKAFRENLFQRALEFQTMITDLESLPSMSPWYLSGFRLEVSISAEGSVSVWANVGGDVRLGFLWKRIMPNPQEKPLDEDLHTSNESDKKDRPLVHFVKGMCEDLKAISESSFQNTSFRPTTIWTGIGMTISGRVFMASISTRIGGTLFFSRNKLETTNPRNSSSSNLTDISERDNLPQAWDAQEKSIPLNAEKDNTTNATEDENGNEFFYIEDAGKLDKLSYAKKNHIPFWPLTSDKSGLPQTSRMIYKINRAKFRKELLKSSRMAKYFISHVPNVGRWTPSTLSFSYEISVTGNLGMVGLSGSSFATVFLKKI